MNIIKDKVVGIDIPIKNLQNYLYPKLISLWNCTDSSLNMYGRAYRNQTTDGYTPEVYVGGNGNEYKEVYFDDTLSASSFFGLGEDTKVANSSSVTADVYLIFMVRLDQIKPGNTRDDEEARIDVEKLCLSAGFGFTVTDFITGIDKVFAEYSGWRQKDGIKYRDTHPWHCFRLNFKVLYSPYACK
jgi:hypothetical protein